MSIVSSYVGMYELDMKMSQKLTARYTNNNSDQVNDSDNTVSGDIN